MARHLKAVGPGDAEPVDARLIERAEELLARVKSGEVAGFWAVLECEGYRSAVVAGEIDPDGIQGFSSRVLASLADNAE